MSSNRFDRVRFSATGPDLLPAHHLDRRRIRTVIAIAAASAAAVTCLSGASASAASAPTTSLEVSAAANRTSATSLHDQHLGGSQYIFVHASHSARVRSVDFYLDGKKLSHEKSAPYDLLGGTSARANPLKVATLSAGRHTVKAGVRLPHRTRWLTGTFVTDAPAAPRLRLTLEVSAHANRTDPSALDGQPLTGPQYVFVDTGHATVSRVTFYLDGKQTAVERKLPYDMYGGTTAAAVPLEVDDLTAGTHTVTAAVKTSTTTRQLRGTFVAAGSPHATTAASDPAPSSSPTLTPTPTRAAAPAPTPTPTSGPTSASSSLGDVTLSTSGAVLSDCTIDTLHATASGLTVRNCTINGGVFGAGSYTLNHNVITSQADGIDPTGAGYKVIEYNKIWRDGTRVADRHHDGIQFWQGGNALISHNWISGFQTSAIMVKADLAAISNVTIDSNYLNNPTGYFQLYLCPVSHGLRGITVTNNAFGKSSFTASTCGTTLTFVHTEAQRQDAIKAGNAAAASWIVWNGNYVAGTNQVVAPPGGWAQ